MRKTTWLVALLLFRSTICRSATSPANPVFQSEIGHLGTETDARSKTNIDHVEVSILTSSVLTLSGKDDKGTPWRAEIPYQSGAGWTSAWTGDFDRNGKNDLLIVSSFPENGSCPGRANVTVLMRDSNGRPFPWSFETRLDSKGSFKDLPIAHAIGNSGALSIITASCGYYFNGKEGVTVSGVYTAQDNHWRELTDRDKDTIVSSARHDGYLTDVRRNEAQVNSLGNDKSNVIAVDATLVSATAPSRKHCEPSAVSTDGDFTKSRSPCSLDLLFSNGIRRYGWPTIVDDCLSKRSIVAPSGGSIKALDQIVSTHEKVVAYGSPKGIDVSMIWAKCQVGAR